ncbi:hypothetical protein FRB94_013039 [Tulasnella sp. JGI-2019a]|nr:hypothetical protein FRB94_013039 [Tulasnella sp. JGI-2019a]
MRSQSTIFNTPEILKEIMLLSALKERAVLARVSHTWSSVALDALWHKLDSIFPLLELIASLEWDSEDELRFPKFVEPPDWERFQSYARRVRDLNWDDGQSSKTRNGHTDGYLSQTVFSDIYLHRPTAGPLLPGLLTLKRVVLNDSTALHLLPFLSGCVTDLHIDLGDDCSHETVNSLLYQLGTREPGVVDFKFFTHHVVDEVDEALAVCLHHMAALEQITLPKQFGAPRIVEALRDLKGLCCILVHPGPINSRDRTISQLGSQWNLQLDEFKTLRELDFQTTVLQAKSALSSRRPSQLTIIYLTTVGAVYNQEVLSMLSALASSCPLLENVSINMFSTLGLSEECFRFDTLVPLLRCGSLELLEIGHPRSVVLAEENIDIIANSWPSLHTLIFCGGSASEKNRTPLSILKAFARHRMLHLREIKLSCFIDLENLRGDPAPMALGSLTSLGLDTTAILPEQQLVVSVFLGFICPSGVAIFGGMLNWQSHVMDNDEMYEPLWAAVEEGVRDFHKIQGAERREREQHRFL